MAVCAKAEAVRKVVLRKSVFSFRKVIFALKIKYPMHARDGQKPIGRHFQSQLEGRRQSRRCLDAAEVGSVGKNNSDWRERKQLTCFHISAIIEI